MPLPIEPAANELPLCLRVKDGETREPGGPHVPKAEEKVKVKLCALPEWVLAGVVTKLAKTSRKMKLVI